MFVPLTVGGGIRGFTDAEGKTYSALEVASEYFRSGADKVSIGGDAVEAAEEYMRNNNVSDGELVYRANFQGIWRHRYAELSNLTTVDGDGGRPY